MAKRKKAKRKKATAGRTAQGRFKRGSALAKRLGAKGRRIKVGTKRVCR